MNHPFGLLLLLLQRSNRDRETPEGRQEEKLTLQTENGVVFSSQFFETMEATGSSHHIKALRLLIATTVLDEPPTSVPVVETLPKSGSSRRYFRFRFASKQTFMGAWNENIAENEAFFSFTETFKENGVLVPRILSVSVDRQYYVLQDLGFETAADFVRLHGVDLSLFKRILDDLLDIQVRVSNQIDYKLCHPCQDFDKQAVQWDLNHFKYSFLMLSNISFDERALETDFQEITSAVDHRRSDKTFMYRDFQLRNIMWLDSKPHFIDYQGGRRGPFQYDVASLLYSPSSKLNREQRRELWNYYREKRRQRVGDSSAGKQVEQEFYILALIRVLQALGSYGLRGIFQRKPGFVQRICNGISNVGEILEHVHLPLPELRRLSTLLTASHDCFATSSSAENLTVRIMSFAYKNGIPNDPTEHGGGFVFDCRGLPNPHQFVELRDQSGIDKDVQDYLDLEPTSREFAEHTQRVIKICLDHHLRRGFSHLCLYFGCTGGQHRSVYHAERLAKWLRKNYREDSIKIKLIHRETESWKVKLTLQDDWKRSRCAFILAAGLGTRLLPLTQDRPKALVEINGKPLLFHAIQKLKRAGFTNIVVNVHHFSDMIVRYVESVKWGVSISISDEREALLETGGAMWHARDLLCNGYDWFLAYNVDVMTSLDLEKIVNAHEQEKNLVTLAVRQRPTQRYFMFNESMQLAGWRNYATSETRVSLPEEFDNALPFAFSGIHVVSTRIFNKISERGKFSVVDLYLRLARHERIAGFEDKSNFWMDLGKPGQIDEAQDWLRARETERIHMNV